MLFKTFLHFSFFPLLFGNKKTLQNFSQFPTNPKPYYSINKLYQNYILFNQKFQPQNQQSNKSKW